MKVLDLFCGAGGAAMGLHRAWPDAEITGVDIKPMPRYPFKFIQADAMTFPLEGYDFIWASPPCQAYSWSAKRWHGKKEYQDLIVPTRDLLQATNKPYCIENVPRAPLINPITLCGTQFGLKVLRHRLFETSEPIVVLMQPCAHVGQVGKDYACVVGHGEPAWVRNKEFFTVAGHGGNGRTRMEFWKEAMGIDWMTRDEITQAIPPAYSEFIARQFHL